tara:strand:+ start:335 stop:517 length:183 start_codon:yes stop_codon:yes gene_type:complete
MNERERYESIKALLAITMLPLLRHQQRRMGLILMMQTVGLVLLAVIIALIAVSRFIYGGA